MRKLIADRSILWGGRMYKPGDELPACALSPVWVENGSAHWAGDASAIEKPAPEIAFENASGEDAVAADKAPDVRATQPKYGRRAAKVEK